jgi:putative flippase GtrA
LTLSGVSPLLSKTIAIPTVATIQFIANKFLTFGRFAQ